MVRWHKIQYACREADCERRAFTEQIGELPAGARVTGRLRRQVADRIGEGLPVSIAGAGLLGWPATHAAFVAAANAQLPDPDPGERAGDRRDPPREAPLDPRGGRRRLGEAGDPRDQLRRPRRLSGPARAGLGAHQGQRHRLAGRARSGLEGRRGSGNGPQVLAGMRNTAINIIRLPGGTNIAAAHSESSYQPGIVLDALSTA